MSTEERRKLTIAAREAWVEVLPIGKPPTYYRHASGGIMLPAGEHYALLDHGPMTFTIEEDESDA